MNSRETNLNNNVLIVATTGAGKTRNVLIPNLLESTYSQVVLDPKGSLYKMSAEILRNKGFKVKRLSFRNIQGSVHYNPLKYVKTPKDIHALAYLLADMSDMDNLKIDPFWPQSTMMLFEMLIACELELATYEKREPNLMNIMNILEQNHDDNANSFQPLFNILHQRNSNSYAYKQFTLFNTISASYKTFSTILMCGIAELKEFYSEELGKMMNNDNLNLYKIGKEKTALFVEVDDIDRSYDKIINIFFTQLLTILEKTADRNINHELEMPVRFVFDDFTSVMKIDNFSNIISTCRSRGISIWMAIQSIQQLREKYPSSESIICDNCDSLIYMGCNDPDTAMYIAKRVGKPRQELLRIPIGSSYIMRRGSKAECVRKNMTLTEFLETKGLEEVKGVIKGKEMIKENS